MDKSILIVGAGTFGTSTAYHLALNHTDPTQVAIIDQAPSPPKPAAAIDVNRIIRTDYASSLYCNLANEALHTWFWSLDLQRYFHKTGWVLMDDSENASVSERVHQVFRDRGADPTSDVDLQRLGERWDVLKGTDTQGFHRAHFNPEAGWCDAAAATANLMAEAEKKGVQRVTARATELLHDSESNRITSVRTADGRTFTADLIVLATGAWTSSLLSPMEDTLHIVESDRIERQVQAVGRVAAYYTLSPAEVKPFTDCRLPVICYGLRGEVIPPSPDNKTLTYRNSETTFANTVTTESGHRISVPRAKGEEDQWDVPETLKRKTEAVISSKVLPGFGAVAKKVHHWRICWDALTPTEDWLMCRHPDDKLGNLFLAVGGSFHSYKFLPNAGKYMINVLQGKSNGVEKDRAWCWKDVGSGQQGVANEKVDVAAPRELREYVASDAEPRNRARL